MLTIISVLFIVFGIICVAIPFYLLHVIKHTSPSSGALGLVFLTLASLLLVPLGAPFAVAGLAVLLGAPWWVLWLPAPVATSLLALGMGVFSLQR